MSPIALGVIPTAWAIVVVGHLVREVVLVSDVVDEIERDDDAVLDRVIVGITDVLLEASNEDVGETEADEAPEAVSLALNVVALVPEYDGAREKELANVLEEDRAGDADACVDVVVLGETEFVIVLVLVAVDEDDADDVFVAVSVGIVVTSVPTLPRGAAP